MNTMADAAVETNALDEPVWGAIAMSEVIKRTPRVTHYLLSTGELPARKVGGRWVSSKRRLLAFLIGEAA